MLRYDMICSMMVMRAKNMNVTCLFFSHLSYNISHNTVCDTSYHATWCDPWTGHLKINWMLTSSCARRLYHIIYTPHDMYDISY